MYGDGECGVNEASLVVVPLRRTPLSGRNVTDSHRRRHVRV